MGERLVFRIIRNGEDIARLHFHWSAYTESVYREAYDLIESLKQQGFTKETTNVEFFKMILHYLIHVNKEDYTCAERDVHACGGFSGDTIKYVREHFKDEIPESLYIPPEPYKVNHSYGLLILDPDKFESYDDWAEDIEDLDFDQQIVTNGLFFHVDQTDPEFKEQFESYGIPKESLQTPPDGFIYDCVPFNKLEEVGAWIHEVSKIIPYFYDDKEQEIIEIRT